MPKKNIWALACISAVFILSRIIFYSLGVRFDAAPLETAIHLIDPIWMRHNLWESLFHMVNQPPLFNLLVAVVYRSFPMQYAEVFHVIYLVHGWALGLGIYALMRHFKVSNTIAIVLSCYLVINPAAILLENWLMYTYLIMAWLCWSAVFLFRYLKHACVRDLIGFVGLLLLLVLTKSIFHLFWMIGLIVCLWLFQAQNRRQIFYVCLIPILLASSLYIKNYLISGNFTTSRLWMTLNLYEMSVKYVSTDELIQLSREQKISVYSSDAVFQDAFNTRPQVHMQNMREHLERPSTGIPMLDSLQKPTSGMVNYHSSFQRMLADVRLKDAVEVLQHNPNSYKYSLVNAYLIMFFPSPTDVTFVNRQHIATYENYYNLMFARLNAINDGKLYSDHLKVWRYFLMLRWDMLSTVLYHYVMCFYLFVYGFAVVFLWRTWSDPKRVPERLVLLFMCFNVLYLIVGHNFFAWIGSNRYRFVIEPFFVVFFGIILTFYQNRSIRPKKLQ